MFSKQICSCWSLVLLQGAFIYEFGDHGGLIVMADDLKKTGEVREINGAPSWFWGVDVTSNIQPALTSWLQCRWTYPLHSIATYLCHASHASYPIRSWTVWGATGRLLRGDFYLEWRRILVRLQGHQHALRGAKARAAKPPDDSIFVFVSCWAAKVDNIITEPNLTSTAFVMFGTREAQRSIHDCRCQWIKVGQAARPPQFSTFFQVSFMDLLLVSWCPGWCPPFHGLTQGWQRCSLLSEVRFARALRSCRSCTVRCLSDLLIQLTQHNHTTPWINWILWTSSPKGCGQ